VTGHGGGLVKAALRPVEGGEQVARYLADLARAAPGNVRLRERTVNGQPGLVARLDGVTVAVYAFDFVGDRITRIWAILNPRQAPALGPPADTPPMPPARRQLPPPILPPLQRRCITRESGRRRLPACQERHTRRVGRRP